jgi:hypothetical protein
MDVQGRAADSAPRQHPVANFDDFRGKKRLQKTTTRAFSLGGIFERLAQAKSGGKIYRLVATNLLTGNGVRPMGCGRRGRKPHPVVVNNPSTTGQ